jgi:hypothetical protein
MTRIFYKKTSYLHFRKWLTFFEKKQVTTPPRLMAVSYYTDQIFYFFNYNFSTFLKF